MGTVVSAVSRQPARFSRSPKVYSLACSVISPICFKAIFEAFIRLKQRDDILRSMQHVQSFLQLLLALMAAQASGKPAEQHLGSQLSADGPARPVTSSASSRRKLTALPINQLSLPPGFSAEVLMEGLAGARMLVLGQGGSGVDLVYVSTAGASVRGGGCRGPDAVQQPSASHPSSVAEPPLLLLV